MELPPTRYFAGLSSYDEQRDPVDHRIDKVLPAEPGLAHSVTLDLFDRPPTEPAILDSWHYKRGLCGRIVKVLLPIKLPTERRRRGPVPSLSGPDPAGRQVTLA